MSWCYEHLPAVHRLGSWFSGADPNPPVLEEVPSVFRVEGPQWNILRNPGVEDFMDLDPTPLFSVPNVRLVIAPNPWIAYSYLVVRYTCFSPDGQVLAACNERHATIYDVATGAETA